MTKNRTKSLHYAYPTSPLADRLNRGKGCWLVGDNSGLPPCVYQDNEREQAFQHFEKALGEVEKDSFTSSHIAKQRTIEQARGAFSWYPKN